MAVRVDIQRTQIFPEFTKEEAEKYFGVKRSKFLHNVDTLYYSVSLDEGHTGQYPELDKQLEHNISVMVDRLRSIREFYNIQSDEEIKIADLTYRPCNFANVYRHCLSEKDAFDIFVAESLPNRNTPRIVVQLRSIALWGLGDRNAVLRSFDAVGKFCLEFGLQVQDVTENRIDWAFHTNSIQNTSKFFGDRVLKNHANGTLTMYQKVGLIGKAVTVDYLSLGRRKSNNVFFRAYNKTREVVEMGYKDIFIKIWHKEKLISDFDKYVLEHAYIEKSFDSGVALGRIQWYLDYGKDPVLKSQLRDLKNTYKVKSSNNTELLNRLDGILPDITQVTNLEFQTKRHFYWRFGKSIKPESAGDCPPKLARLFAILDNRQKFLDILSSETVRFVKDRSKPVKQLEETDYLDFWRRLRSVKLPCNSDDEIFREYHRNADLKRARRNLANQVATLSMFTGQADNDSFALNFADALCYFNDNDVSRVFDFVSENGEVLIDYEDYERLKANKRRQYKFFLDEMKKAHSQELEPPENEPNS